jgi:hypothetical protein
MIEYCNLALFMTNSTFSPTCADDGSVNVYISMYVSLDASLHDTGNCVTEL